MSVYNTYADIYTMIYTNVYNISLLGTYLYSYMHIDILYLHNVKITYQFISQIYTYNYVICDFI